jgi:hypothetical protein
MRSYYKVPLRLRSIFHKNQAELDLNEELQFHLQNRIDEYVAGMNPKEARHARRSIPQPIADAPSGSGRCGKRHSTTPAHCCQRWKSCWPSWFSFC